MPGPRRPSWFWPRVRSGSQPRSTPSTWVSATHHAAFAGVLARRPYADFLVINLAALAVAVGPAAWRWPTAPLVAVAAAAVIVTDLLGVTRCETERVWLPFV